MFLGCSCTGRSLARHVAVRDGHGRHLPRARHSAARQALEVELAADLGVGAARVRHVVAVEWHHVRQDVRGAHVV